MIRVTCAVLMTLALPGPAGPPDVDAVTFALAFRAGSADRSKNRQVSGSGVSFHGGVSERVADGSTRTSLVITLGAAGPDGKPTLLRTWDDFVAAERERIALVVALSGPDLPRPSAQGPVTVAFSGVYDGQGADDRPPAAGRRLCRGRWRPVPRRAATAGRRREGQLPLRGPSHRGNRHDHAIGIATPGASSSIMRLMSSSTLLFLTIRAAHVLLAALWVGGCRLHGAVRAAGVEGNRAGVRSDDGRDRAPRPQRLHGRARRHQRR